MGNIGSEDQNNQIKTLEISPKDILLFSPQKRFYHYPEIAIQIFDVNDEFVRNTKGFEYRQKSMKVKIFQQVVSVNLKIHDYMSDSFQKTFKHFKIFDAIPDEGFLDKVLYEVEKDSRKYSMSIKKYNSISDKTQEERLIREIITNTKISSLNGSNIMFTDQYLLINKHKITKFGEKNKEKEQTLILLMEEVSASLSEIIKMRREHKKQWEVQQFYFLMKDVVTGMQFLHSTEFSHNDIRPSSIYYCSGKDKYMIGNLSRLTKYDYNFQIKQFLQNCYFKDKKVLDRLSLSKNKRFGEEQMEEIDLRKSDMYSLGMTLLSAFYLCQPIDLKLCMPINRVFVRQYPFIEVLMMMVKDTNARYTINDAINHLEKFQTFRNIRDINNLSQDNKNFEIRPSLEEEIEGSQPDFSFSDFEQRSQGASRRKRVSIQKDMKELPIQSSKQLDMPFSLKRYKTNASQKIKKKQTLYHFEAELEVSNPTKKLDYNKTNWIKKAYTSLGMLKEWKQKISECFDLLETKSEFQNLIYLKEKAEVNALLGQREISINFYKKVALTYYSIGQSCLELEQYTRAEVYFEDGVKCYEVIQKNDIVFLKCLLGLILVKVRRGEELIHSEDVDRINKEIQNLESAIEPLDQIKINDYFAESYFFMKEFKTAEKMYLKNTFIVEKISLQQRRQIQIKLYLKLVRCSLEWIKICPRVQQTQEELKVCEEYLNMCKSQCDLEYLEECPFKFEIKKMLNQLLFLNGFVQESIMELLKLVEKCNKFMNRPRVMMEPHIQASMSDIMGDIYFLLGTIESTKNQIPNSYTFFHEALEKYKNLNGGYYNIHCGLTIEQIGNLHQRNSQFLEAEECLDLAKTILSNQFQNTHQDIKRIDEKLKSLRILNEDQRKRMKSQSLFNLNLDEKRDVYSHSSEEMKQNES